MQLRPHAGALVDGDRRFTWTEIGERVARLAGALRMTGVGPDDRVALLAFNSHRSYESYFGALMAGGVILPLNHRLSEAEMFAQIEDARPVVLLADSAFIEMATRLKSAAPWIRTLIVLNDPEPSGECKSYERLIAEVTLPVEDAMRGGDDMACMFYTGGTTGSAKGVMLSHANIIANGANFITHLGIDEQIVHLHCGPLFHVAAGVRLFSVTQLAGTHVILPRFAADEVLDTIAREGVTLATFVPTMLRGLLDALDGTDRDLSSLRYITYGGAPMPEALLREAMEQMPHVRFAQSYGMTETSPIITMLGWRDHLPDAPTGRLRSAGQAATFAEVAIVDSQDRPVAAGECGEIVARGPMVMLGYWNRPEATAEVLRGGWMHTGDVGRLDADGYLTVVDRIKDVIISGGENIYSQEVENAISSHPAVFQCAVFGRPDERWGETVHASIMLRADASVTQEEIIAHCKSLIASYKAPRSVELRTEPLPLSGANKILKQQLKQELLEREKTPS